MLEADCWNVRREAVGKGYAGDMAYNRIITSPHPSVSRIHSMKAFCSCNSDSNKHVSNTLGAVVK